MREPKPSLTAAGISIYTEAAARRAEAEAKREWQAEIEEAKWRFWTDASASP